jgi:hypothetical protein
MSIRHVLAAAVVLAALVLPVAAPAYPPITCGRTTISGKTYIVRTHGPNCTFATKWVRAFVQHRHKPKGYSCRAYGTGVPADCIKNKKTYFLATKS